MSTPSKSQNSTRKSTILKRDSEVETDTIPTATRKSGRLKTPSRNYADANYYCESPKNSTPNKIKKINNSSENDNNSEKSGSDTEENADNIPNRQTVLFGDEDVAGSSVYSFKTPKKKDAMTTVAAITPKTPTIVKTPKTPKSSTARTPKSSTKTPNSSVNRRLAIEDKISKTPGHVRAATKRAILRKNMENNEDFSSDSENDYQPNSSSSDSDNTSSDSASDASIDEQIKTPSPVKRTIKIVPKTPNTRSRNRQDLVLESDSYFSNHASKKVTTSDHTLDRLKTPRLPHEDLFRMLAAMKLSSEHEQCITNLNKQYECLFDKWMFILNENFSILLFGFGSKRNLLELFHRNMLAHEMCVVVNGYFPGLTIKEILDTITVDLLDMTIESRNVHEIVDEIEDELKKLSNSHMFLIVHNIDGIMLRNHNAQLCLSRLAKISNIHLLASIDHINTPFLWDFTKLNNYNFTWWDTTTMLPYTNETAFENSMLVQNSGSLALSSMKNVFLSLASNSRNVFLIIIKYQIENKHQSHYQGMSSDELYRKCRESFLASSTTTYRAQLGEFLDHRLLKMKRGADGAEYLTIPLDNELLKQFLDEQANE